MIIDATFWVAISFIIFVLGLVYLKIPNKINNNLNQQINLIKDEIKNAERLKDEAKSLLNEYEDKLNSATNESKDLISNAKKESEKIVIENTEKFYLVLENRKKIMNQKISQLKDEAFRNIQNNSIEIAIGSIEHLLKTSIDKSKLDNLYSKNLNDVKALIKEQNYIK